MFLTYILKTIKSTQGVAGIMKWDGNGKALSMEAKKSENKNLKHHRRHHHHHYHLNTTRAHFQITYYSEILVLSI